MPPPNPTDASASNAYAKGLPCELAIVDVFDESGERTLPRPVLRAALARKGFARTTIERTIPKMLRTGNLAVRPGSVVELVCRDLPWTRRVHDPRPNPANRFGNVCHEANVNFVRQFLADRLDELWETPNSYLSRVLRAVELAGRIAEAACLNRPHALAETIDEYKREWLDKEPNTWRKPLDAVRLFEALQTGLFVESFEDDEEVKRELTEHYEKMAAERKELIEKVNRENTERLARGEKAEQLPTAKFETPKDALRGLVPASGGARVGAARIAAYVKAIGAKE